MKDHVQEQRDVCLLGSVEDAIYELQNASEGLKDATLESYWDEQLYVTGWRPMTDAELEKQKKRRAAARKAAAVRKEKQREADEKQLAKLAKKLGKEVK